MLAWDFKIYICTQQNDFIPFLIVLKCFKCCQENWSRTHLLNIFFVWSGYFRYVFSNHADDRDGERNHGSVHRRLGQRRLGTTEHKLLQREGVEYWVPCATTFNSSFPYLAIEMHNFEAEMLKGILVINLIKWNGKGSNISVERRLTTIVMFVFLFIICIRGKSITNVKLRDRPLL